MLIKDESQILEDYEKGWDERWERGWGSYYWRLHPFYRAVEQYLHSSPVLDIGCGAGFLAARVFPNLAWYTGVDISGKAVELGEMLFPGAKFLRHDAEHKPLPFKDNSFATVVCSELIEHLEDYSLLLSEIQRVSRAYMVITVPVNMHGCGHVWPVWGYDDVIEQFSQLGKILVVHIDLEHNFYLLWIRKKHLRG